MDLNKNIIMDINNRKNCQKMNKKMNNLTPNRSEPNYNGFGYNNFNLKKIMALWMIVLIVTLPLYSASVWAASIKITGNRGTANIEGFINADGDTWAVEATITGVPASSGAAGVSINPADVRLNVGSLSEPFSACSNQVTGTVCSYSSNLENGIREGDYNFNVNYQGVSQAGIIKADGSGPEIRNIQASQQNDGSIDLQFTAADSSDGMASLEVLDERGIVLHSISITSGQREVVVNEKLPGINSGEGLRVIRVRATDRLGHETVSGGISFRTDFIAPVAEKVNLTILGRFIGLTAFKSDLLVDVRETSEFQENMLRVSSAAGSAGRTSLENSNPQQCLRDDDQFDLWHCLFREVQVSPAETISFEIFTIDQFGNPATVSRSLSFTLDSKAPATEFFGTEKVFDGQSYFSPARAGKSRIVLRFKEEGAGIDNRGIRANLGGIGGSLSAAPDYFNETAGEAYWDLTSGVGGARISLVALRDKAGNEDPAQLVETGLVIDATGPRIERLEFLGVSEQDEHSFLQSQDQLKIVFTAREDSGLQVLVNLNGLVDNAGLKYPPRGLDIKEGWIELTEEDGCSRLLGVWECSLLVPELLRSGTGRNVDLELKIKDTAGNDVSQWPSDAGKPKNVEREVSNGRYKIVLLGLSEEENPDFWSVSSVRTTPGFVDLDTAQLAPARIQANVRLTSLESTAEILSANLGRCEASAGAPELRNSLFYGGLESGGEAAPEVKIILELEPFDGRSQFNIGAEKEFKQAVGEYKCTLQLFSKLGRNAVRTAEIQEVPITINFGFTSNGALDENLALKVQELKENDLFKISSALSFLASTVKIINFAGRIYQILIAADQIYNLFSSSAQAQVSLLRTQPELELVGIEAYITALKGGCYSAQVGSKFSWEFLNTLQIPMNILACNPGIKDEKGGYEWSLGWYGNWQRGVLGFYNLASGRSVLGVPATSLQENLYTSIVGVCIPGLILNMEKARELHCRKIICYGREVPAGVATIESCDRLYDIQLCEFVVGNFWDAIGFGGIAEITRLLQAAFSSPLGWISITEVAACWNLCFIDVGYVPGVTDVQTCKAFTGINKALKIIDNLVGAVQSFKPAVGSQYCGQIDDINLEELTGGKFLPSEEAERGKGGTNTGSQPSSTPRVGAQTNI
ncbi:MAG TPA: hypothetical protein VJH68_02355 [Candidatus Nanoarchaeia archaeon]|nr:hypothetical protein [Candidatus Nanoarchaeia archaeon]